MNKRTLGSGNWYIILIDLDGKEIDMYKDGVIPQDNPEVPPISKLWYLIHKDIALSLLEKW